MDKEYVVVYWAHGSKRYTAVGIPDKATAQEYARRCESKYHSVAKIVEMPSRVLMSAKTDALLQTDRSLW